jgi:hypothetical protein
LIPGTKKYENKNCCHGRTGLFIEENAAKLNGSWC